MRSENKVGWASRLIVGTLALTGALVAAPAAMAATGDATCHPPTLCATAPAPLTPALSGMWVQLDGRTGRLGSPANPVVPPAISRLLSQNSRGLRVVERKSGRLSMALDGRFLRAMTAHVDANGHVVVSCDTDDANGKGE